MVIPWSFKPPTACCGSGPPGRVDEGVPLASGQAPHRFVAVSPDGVWAATSGRFEPARVWDLKSRRFVHEFPISERSNDNGQVIFDPAGKFLVTCDSYAYRWYRVGDWQLVSTLNRQSGGPGHVAYSPDGKLLALEGPGRSILLLDAASRTELAAFASPDQQVPAYLCFSRDSKLLIEGGYGPCLRIWDLPKIRRTLAAMNLDW